MLDDVGNPRCGPPSLLLTGVVWPAPPAHLVRLATLARRSRMAALRSVHTHAAAAIINFVTDSEYDDDEEDEDDGGDYQSPVARAFAPYSDLVLEKARGGRGACAPHGPCSRSSGTWAFDGLACTLPLLVSSCAHSS